MRSRLGRNAVAVVVDDDSPQRPFRRDAMRYARARVANGVLEQIARQFAEPALVAVNDRADRLAFDAHAAARRERLRVSRDDSARRPPDRRVRIAARGVPGSRASVKRSVTTADASNALRDDRFECRPGVCRWRIDRAACAVARDRGERRTQLVRGIGGKCALAFARRLQRRDRGSRREVGRKADDRDERDVDGSERQCDAAHRGAESPPLLRASPSAGASSDAYSRATKAYAPALSATRTQTKIAR